MAIKVGNSWVSEAAYAHASARLSPDIEDVNMDTFSKKYPEIKFNTNKTPFKADGR